MSLLEARELRAGFGSHQILHGVDLMVGEGEIAGVFGLNGAGKSVTMKVLAGLIPAWSGSIIFDGVDITRLSPEKRVAAGISNVPQGRQVFPALTVEENLRIGAYTSRRKERAQYPARLAEVYDRLPMLASRRGQLAGSLSGGEQAALAVGRALVNAPRLILVDEPSAGLAPVIVNELGDILRRAVGTGVAMILVEQNVTFGLSLVDRAHIMQTGRIVYQGPVAELDHETLAGQLGIGRMLTRTTASALADRSGEPSTNGSPDGKPRAKRKAPARAKRKVPARAPKATKTARTAKTVAVKKPDAKKTTAAKATRKTPVKKATAKKPASRNGAATRGKKP